jgi:hypothetical protein
MKALVLILLLTIPTLASDLTYARAFRRYERRPTAANRARLVREWDKWQAEHARERRRVSDRFCDAAGGYDERKMMGGRR